ncbi:MAG: dihydroneopterin aldolase [SAR202 cluster bacterium]|nr:dihydroneopterin aldolase [SAR202 cluster bacterium]
MQQPRDRILLERMVFYGYHGATPRERETGQRFEVDVEAFADLTKPGMSDQLEDAVDYSKVFAAVKEVVEGRPRRLLESVAEAIATRLLEGFDVAVVRVRVRKPDVPIARASIGSAGVEIYREK